MNKFHCHSQTEGILLKNFRQKDFTHLVFLVSYDYCNLGNYENYHGGFFKFIEKPIVDFFYYNLYIVILSSCIYYKKKVNRYLITIVIWLILPVVICLSQRLSHACLSISDII